MSDELITPAMRATIGKESEPVTFEVDRTAVRMFARSVGHVDPVYYDIEAAKAAGYRDLPAPPGYLGTPIYDPSKSDPTSGRRIAGSEEPQPSRPLNRRLNGGTEIEYLADLCAGDVLTARTHVADLQERKGSIGQMLISTSKTTYRNERGDVVAVMTGTGIRY